MRKLIKFGKNSHVVSLPKGWLEANKLKKGDIIYLDERSGSIVLMASEEPMEERVGKVNCDGKEFRAVIAEVVGYYKAGFTTIILEGESIPERADQLKDLFHQLAGMEIVEQSLKRIVAKDLIDIKQVALPTLLARMDMMVRSMFQDLLDDPGVPAEVLQSRDKDVNRLQLLLSRVVVQLFENPALGHVLGVMADEAYYIDRIAWSLERIGDYLKRMNRELLMIKPQGRRLLRESMQKVYALYLETMKVYNRKNAEGVPGLIIRVRETVISFREKVSLAKSPHELLILENISNLLRDLRVVLRMTIELTYKRRVRTPDEREGRAPGEKEHASLP